MEKIQLNFPERESFIGTILLIDEASYDSKSTGKEEKMNVLYVETKQGKAVEFVSATVLADGINIGDTVIATVENRIGGHTNYVTNGVTKTHENTGLSAVGIRKL